MSDTGTFVMAAEWPWSGIDTNDLTGSTVAAEPLTACEVETVRQLVEQGYLPAQADRLARILGGLKPVTA